MVNGEIRQSKKIRKWADVGNWSVKIDKSSWLALLVRGHYKAKLVVMNIGDVFTTGPKEAAFVINEMVKPSSVIVSHANEVATKGGKVVAGTKTDTFIKAAKMPVHVPLSERTMEFDGDGNCTAGC